ncbi:MAG: Gfo/Idh/MocA family oxidoreductase [bacterium]|nr:Gfo/Idh/MocA family oxidoreductase [bacterium]
MKTRVAVVGLGKMGLMHASIFSMLDEVELVALCEKNSFVSKFGKKVLPDINIVSDLAQLSDMGLDAVCVTTPPASHFPIIKTIYTSNIAHNVFTEKPLASTHDQAEELCHLAKTYGGVNMVGYHRRFCVTFTKAKQILMDGILGHLVSFEGYAYSADFLGAKSTQSLARGGVIEDSAVHIIDLVLWLLGNMEVKNARIESLLGDGSEDEAFFDVLTPEGTEGKIKTSWCKEGYRLPEMGLLITGNNGTIRINEDLLELELNGQDSSSWYKHDLDDIVPFFIGGAEYQRQDELFIRSISDDSAAEPSFSTASKVEELVDQVNSHARGLATQ